MQLKIKAFSAKQHISRLSEKLLAILHEYLLPYLEHPLYQLIYGLQAVLPDLDRDTNKVNNSVGNGGIVCESVYGQHIGLKVKVTRRHI